VIAADRTPLSEGWLNFSAAFNASSLSKLSTGAYRVVIPCLFEGQPINLTARMYLDDEPPISAGRELWIIWPKQSPRAVQMCRDVFE